jgi:GTPase
VGELLEAVEEFRARAESSGLLARKRRALLARQLEEVLHDRLMRRVRSRVLTPEETARIVDRMVAREVDPFSAADEVLGRMGL